MAGEFDTYRDRVLDAARRAGNVLPPDLFVRYNIDPRRTRSADMFIQRVDAVVKFWRGLTLQIKYRPLASALLAADAELRSKNRMSLEAFAKQRAECEGQARTRLDADIAGIAETWPFVTIAVVRRLVATVGGVFDEDEVRAALKGRGVTVVDPLWELPAQPPVSAARSLPISLTALGYKLSPEVLFGADAVRAGFRLRDGFRLTADGRTVTRDALDQARLEQARSRHDERKTATDNVLAVLAAAVDDADRLHKLLLWEVQEQLRPDVKVGLPPLIAQNAAKLGLDATEAKELATALVSNGDSRPADAQLAETTRQVNELVAAADSALAAGDQEKAAGLLSDAIAITTDDRGLHERLAAIPPPPPPDVKAKLEGARMMVHWTPSPARTAGVRYRVVRASQGPAVSSGAGILIVETTANEAVDEIPPAGDAVYYTVFATRGGAWSAGASTDRIECVPQVGDVDLRADKKAVIGSWRAHPSATVAITRTRRDSPLTPDLVPLADACASTFVDTKVDIGGTYDYSFRAVYSTQAGQRRMSQPVIVSITLAAPPSLVEGLTHELIQRDGTAVVQVSWRPPSSGVVEIRVSNAEPDWPEDTLMSRAAVTAFGRPAGGELSVDDNGRVTLVFPAPSGLAVLTAVTLVADQARIGGSIVISRVDPVSELDADRRGNQVWLKWRWPQSATLARVRWWPADAPGPPVAVGQVEISDASYRDAGGVRVDVLPGPVVVSVQIVARGCKRESVSAAVTTTVPDSRIEVAYQVRTAGLLGRRHEVVLVSDRYCRLPALIVVHRVDGIQPLRPNSGTTVTTVEPCDLIADRPVVVPLPGRVDPPSGLACFVDPNSPPADEVKLVSMH